MFTSRFCLNQSLQWFWGRYHPERAIIFHIYFLCPSSHLILFGGLICSSCECFSNSKIWKYVLPHPASPTNKKVKKHIFFGGVFFLSFIEAQLIYKVVVIPAVQSASFPSLWKHSFPGSCTRGEIGKVKNERTEDAHSEAKSTWVLNMMRSGQTAQVICAQLCREILGFRG